MTLNLSLIITIVVLLVSVFTDIKYRKIYNWLTFPAMIVGIALSGFPFNTVSYVRLAWMAGFFLFGMLGLIGLGDLKLFMAVVALRGYMETIWAIVFGGLAMFIYLLFTERKLMVQTLKGYLNTAIYHTDMIPRTGKGYPFAPFFAAGYCIAFAVLHVI